MQYKILIVFMQKKSVAVVVQGQAATYIFDRYQRPPGHSSKQDGHAEGQINI